MSHLSPVSPVPPVSPCLPCLPHSEGEYLLVWGRKDYRLSEKIEEWSPLSLLSPLSPQTHPPASKACSNHGNQSCYERERKLSLEKGPQTTWCLREGWVRTKARVSKGDPC